MSKNNKLVPTISQIEGLIFTFRNTQVIVDSDLAVIYGVETKRVNEQVKRNIARFPPLFLFQLTNLEKLELVAICDRFANLKHSTVNPYVFTEQGVAMLSVVLRSDRAVQVSVQIMTAFVHMRRILSTQQDMILRLDKVESTQIDHDQKFEQLFNALENRYLEPSQGIFFDGQVFDAYQFVADLIRKAKFSIVLIDNYIDDRVLLLLSKKSPKVACTILCNKISDQMKLDVQKCHEQYPSFELKRFTQAHDRFLILDDTQVYHFGASLKDLGKKWFAFSKLDRSSVTVIRQLKQYL